MINKESVLDRHKISKTLISRHRKITFDGTRNTVITDLHQWISNQIPISSEDNCPIQASVLVLLNHVTKREWSLYHNHSLFHGMILISYEFPVDWLHYPLFIDHMMIIISQSQRMIIISQSQRMIIISQSQRMIRVLARHQLWVSYPWTVLSLVHWLDTMDHQSNLIEQRAVDGDTK
jgi:hypothetical protein